MGLAFDNVLSRVTRPWSTPVPSPSSSTTATTTRAGSVGSLPSPTTSWNAAALRDAAYDAHVPVPHGEGSKQKTNLTAAGLSSVKNELASWGHFDASRMVAVPVDPAVVLRTVSFEYHSNKPMEAWLDAVPSSKKLELQVVTCVSGHDNLPHARFATENIYEARVTGPSGTLTSPSFGPGISHREEYSSVSPTLKIDISQPGDYVVTCAPRGSAGTGGYVEARQLIVHVTGREPTL
jgi:hypothetical protein